MYIIYVYILIISSCVNHVQINPSCIPIVVLYVGNRPSKKKNCISKALRGCLLQPASYPRDHDGRDAIAVLVLPPVK